jgi:hypothetical protein
MNAWISKERERRRRRRRRRRRGEITEHIQAAKRHEK